MKKGILVLIIFGSIATTVGAVVFGIGLANDINALQAHKETHEYELTEAFNSINIEGDSGDFTFIYNSENVNKVVAEEDKYFTTSVGVTDNVLTISNKNNKKWYENFFYSVSPKITVYLANTDYQNLVVNNSTGDINVPGDFTFDNVAIKVSTGDINFKSTVKDALAITSSTGNHVLTDASMKSLSLEASTGRIELNNVLVENDINLKTSTGNMKLTGVKATNLTTTCSTGGVTLANVEVSNHIYNKASTGDITYLDSDASTIQIETSTGDVNLNLLTPKIMSVSTKTGDVDVPTSLTGGLCQITTSTGDITVRFK